MAIKGKKTNASKPADPKSRIGSGKPGPGRPKGIPNAINRDLKEMILGALSDAGGQAYLMRQAEENPGPFLSLVAKVLPKELVGRDGGPIEGSLTVSVAWEDAKK